MGKEVKNFEDWIIEQAVGPKEKSPVIWLNRDEFVKTIERDSLTLRIQDKDSIFSVAGIDNQLSSILDAGIIFLRTGADWKDLEEFAVRKVNGVWKFSMCSQVLEDLKYKN